MKTVTTPDQMNAETNLSLDVIRERVKRIKASWSTQTARERAEEGKRRRAELERLLSGNPTCAKPAKCDFTLVG